MDTNTSYICSCNPGYILAADGHSCDVNCGGNFTLSSGSFQTPGWPDGYPQKDFQCEWIFDMGDQYSIKFTINGSAFGIKGQPPCRTDHIQFFDGTNSNATSLGKICGTLSIITSITPITTSSSSARVVFTGSRFNRLPNRVGVKVDFMAVGMYHRVQ